MFVQILQLQLSTNIDKQYSKITLLKGGILIKDLKELLKALQWDASHLLRFPVSNEPSDLSDIRA